MKTVGTLASVLGVAICGACGGTQDRPPLIDDFVTADRPDDGDHQDPTGEGSLASDAASGVDEGDGGGDVSSDSIDGGLNVMPEQPGRRLGLPCEAPLPTGFCAISDKGDGIGIGKGYQVAGADVVSVEADKDLLQISLNIEDDTVINGWFMRIMSPSQDALKPDLYESAERFAEESEAIAGFDFGGDGRGCNKLDATFSIEELEVDPSSGIKRISVTFEQHCEGSTPAMRGVVNFQATGTPEPTLVPDVSLELEGNVIRTAYSPEAHLAYGVDATNRKLVEINLQQGVTQQADTPQEGNDLCLDETRGRVYIVNKGSSLISEHQVSDLSLVREIEWTGTDWGPEETHFKIYCAPDKVYVVDGAAEPVLFTIEDLDAEAPVVIEHLTGVGALTFTQDGGELYYSHQNGWGSGWTKSFVTRLDAASFTASETSSEDVFLRDPLDAPILLDEEHGLLIAKNVVFDAQDFTNILYTFPSNFDDSGKAFENAYALDDVGGLLATKSFIYELGHYSVVVPTLKRVADQLFFDRDGGLWFLDGASGTLERQVVSSPFR